MAYWVWILWTTRLFHLSLNSPSLKCDPLLYSRSQYVWFWQWNLEEGMSSPLFRSMEIFTYESSTPKVFLCGSVIMASVMNGNLKSITGWNTNRLQKYPSLVPASPVTLDGITNRTEKMEVGESAAKSKPKNIKRAFLNGYSWACHFPTQDLYFLP